MDSVSAHYMKQARALLHESHKSMRRAESRLISGFWHPTFDPCVARDEALDAADLVLMATHLLQKAIVRKRGN